MILVRDVLKIDPAHMQEAKKIARENNEHGKKQGYPEMIVMTDLTGEFYKLVLESKFDSLAHYEQLMKRMMESKDWKKTYPRLRKFLRGGKREIYRIVD